MTTQQDPVPREFSTRMTVHLTDIWDAEITMKTGEQVASFSGEFVSRDVAFYVYDFDFEYEAKRWSFRCTRDPKKTQTGDSVLVRLNVGDEATAFINGANLATCWFAGEVRNVFPWEPGVEAAP